VRSTAALELSVLNISIRIFYLINMFIARIDCFSNKFLKIERDQRNFSISRAASYGLLDTLKGLTKCPFLSIK